MFLGTATGCPSYFGNLFLATRLSRWIQQTNEVSIKGIPTNPAQSGISQRDFLKTAGITAGGLAVTGLAGCRRQSPAPTGGPIPTRTLKEKKVGLSSPHRVEILNEFYADMKKEAGRPENQIDLVLVDAGGNAVKQSGDLEGFIAQGYDGIFFVALPSAGLEQIVATAVKKGIYVFNHSASPITGCTQNVVLDQKASGQAVGQSAAQWIIDHHAGKAEIGILGNRTDPLLFERTQGMKMGVTEHAPQAKIVGEVEGHSIELGAAGAANLLQAHPDIKVLLAHADDPGFGAYTAATEAGKKDPREFFIGSADGTQLVVERIAEGGIYQTTWSYLFALSATQWMRDMEKCLRGEKVSPTRIQIGRLLTQENLEQVQAIVKNPQAPEAQKYYLDPTVMQYSDTPLTTPQI